MSICITKTPKADTRITQKPVSKEELLHDTKAHIDHVIAACQFFCDELMKQVKEHDHTKVQFIDEFHADFLKAQQGGNFKEGEWWQYHLEERHHWLDRAPKDINMKDIIEGIMDDCVAGLARSGDIYEKEIPPELLTRSIKNTILWMKYNIEVKNE